MVVVVVMRAKSMKILTSLMQINSITKKKTISVFFKSLNLLKPILLAFARMHPSLQVASIRQYLVTVEILRNHRTRCRNLEKKKKIFFPEVT